MRPSYPNDARTTMPEATNQPKSEHFEYTTAHRKKLLATSVVLVVKGRGVDCGAEGPGSMVDRRRRSPVQVSAFGRRLHLPILEKAAAAVGEEKRTRRLNMKTCKRW